MPWKGLNPALPLESLSWQRLPPYCLISCWWVFILSLLFSSLTINLNSHHQSHISPLLDPHHCSAFPTLKLAISSLTAVLHSCHSCSKLPPLPPPLFPPLATILNSCHESHHHCSQLPLPLSSSSTTVKPQDACCFLILYYIVDSLKWFSL